MSKEKLNAFYELINGFEIVGALTEDGTKFIKEGVQHLQQENKQLKEVIEEVRESIKDFQEYIDEAKDFYGDLDDNDVVKVSNLQILNNQMVRNYDLLQILDKVKDSDVK